MRYDRTRPDETTLAESDTANNRCVRTHRNSFFDPRFHRYPIRIAAARREIVRQNGIWTKKDIIGNVHVLPDADSIFNRYVIADCYSALDESVIADVAVITDTNVFQHVSERPDASTFADSVCFDQRFLVNE